MSGLFPVAAGYAKWYRLRLTMDVVMSPRPLSSLSPTAAWIVGLLAGFVGTSVALVVPLIGVLIYAVLAAGLVLRSRARAAVGGGLLLMTGLWFTYLDQSMKARCEAMNTASGSCTVIDPIGSLIPALTFALAGTALSVYALFLGKRSLRGGE